MVTKCVVRVFLSPSLSFLLKKSKHKCCTQEREKRKRNVFFTIINTCVRRSVHAWWLPFGLATIARHFTLSTFFVVQRRAKKKFWWLSEKKILYLITHFLSFALLVLLPMTCCFFSLKWSFFLLLFKHIFVVIFIHTFLIIDAWRILYVDKHNSLKTNIMDGGLDTTALIV
jgi:hypothetical protein